MNSQERQGPAPLDQIRRLPTAVLSDALDRLSLPGSAHGLSPLRSGQRMCGPAFTIRYVPAGAEPGTVGDFIDDVPRGAVIAIDNQGRTDRTVWGDILTSVAHQRGIAGTAIWGACRDVATARELGYPVYSSGQFMRTGKDRVAVAEIGGVIALGDAQVRPGDIIAGDDDGIVVIPASRASDVASAAASIESAETRIRKAALSGQPLAEARRAHGYHELQRRGDA